MAPALLRRCDPMMGRFLQTDPIGYGDGANIYAYVHGDPVNHSDPSGKWDDMGAALQDDGGGGNVEAFLESGAGFGGEAAWGDGGQFGYNPGLSPGDAASMNAQAAVDALAEFNDDGGDGDIGDGDNDNNQNLPPPPPLAPPDCQSCHSSDNQAVATDAATSAAVGELVVNGIRQFPIVQGIIVVEGLVVQSVNQMNQQIIRGLAPRGVRRVDKGKVKGEKDHVHLNDGSALNSDGTAKHGTPKPSNAIINWLRSFGWNV